VVLLFVALHVGLLKGDFIAPTRLLQSRIYPRVICNVLADLVHSQKSKGPNKTPSIMLSHCQESSENWQAFVKGTLCIHMLFCSFSCCPSIHCHINSIYSTITLLVPGVQVVLAFQVFLHTLASHWTTVYKFPILPIECTVTL